MREFKIQHYIFLKYNSQYDVLKACQNQDMMTSSNGNISVLLALCAGNSSVTGEFPTQRPVARCFDVFFDLRVIKRLSKQS